MNLSKLLPCKQKQNIFLKNMNSEIFTSLFWLSFAAYISIESYRLGVGKWGMPGPGYFTFGSGLLLGIISVSALVNALRRVPLREKSTGSLERPRYKIIVLILVAMVGYFFLLNTIGFFLCTLFFSFFFLRFIMSQRWLTTLIVTFSVTLALYLLFNILLNAQLPRGILKFIGV